MNKKGEGWWNLFWIIFFFIIITEMVSNSFYRQMMYDNQLQQQDMYRDAMYDDMYRDMMYDDMRRDAMYEDMYNDLIMDEIERDALGISGMPSIPDCSSNIYNCADFSTWVEAQTVMKYCLDKVGSDIHHLDGDEDGKACESLS